LDAMLENYIFYISRMYEFSHSLGHSRPSDPALTLANVRSYSNSDQECCSAANDAKCRFCCRIDLKVLVNSDSVF
jgi:hypothetical protein